VMRWHPYGYVCSDVTSCLMSALMSEASQSYNNKPSPSVAYNNRYILEEYLVYSPVASHTLLTLIVPKAVGMAVSV
jgi:hypothetical protein